MEVSGHFSSKYQRHLQAPGCAVGVMHAGWSVEMVSRTIGHLAVAKGTWSSECCLEGFRSTELKSHDFFKVAIQGGGLVASCEVL